MILHYKHMLSSSSLHKNKEVLTRNGGGKFGKGICFSSSYWLEVSVTLEHETPYSSFEAGLGNPFVSHSICYKVIPCVVFESMLSNLWSCHPYVQELSIWNFDWIRPSAVILSICVSLPCVQSPIATCSVSSSNSVTHFVSLMGDTSRTSCDESCSIDFSTLSRIKT